MQAFVTATTVLGEPVLAGSTTLVLANVAGIRVGSSVVIGAGATREVNSVVAVTRAARSRRASGPGLVTLNAALAHNHAVGTTTSFSDEGNEVLSTSTDGDGANVVDGDGANAVSAIVGGVVGGVAAVGLLLGAVVLVLKPKCKMRSASVAPVPAGNATPAATTADVAGAAGVEVRGKCAGCNQPVFSNQPRDLRPDGSYVHANLSNCLTKAS